MSDKQDCFQWTEEESQRILQVNGTNEETLRQDVENIKKWIKTQLHFPEMPSKIYIFDIPKRCVVFHLFI